MIRTYGGRILRRSNAWYLSRSSCYPKKNHDATCNGSMMHQQARYNNNTSTASNRNEVNDNIGRPNTPSPPPPPPPSVAAEPQQPTISSIISTSTKSFAVGSVAGLLGSLAGMGGGFVMIPLMTSRYIFGEKHLTQHEAHGTSLFAVAATGFAGAISYYNFCANDSNDNNQMDATTGSTGRQRSHANVVRVPEAAAIALTAIVTARWGAQATLHISGSTLKRALGCLMLVMAPAVPAKAYYLQSIVDQPTNPSIDKGTFHWDRFLYPTIIGMGSGFLSGLFGVGGGTIIVPALTLLTDMTHHEALGTSLAAMILPALSGTYTHYQAGNCAMRVAPFLATGALVGAYVGAKQSLQTDEGTLRLGFGALLATLGIRTLMKT